MLCIMHHQGIRRVFLYLFLVTSFPVFSQAQLFTTDHDIITDTRFMQSLIPYSEGSENEKVIIKFIETRLSLLGMPYRARSFDKAVNSHSFSQIIEVDIAGERDETIVVCIPMNSLPLTGKDAMDPSFSIALGLSVILAIPVNTPAGSLKVLFLGAQLGNEPGYPLGTRLFLETFYPEQPHVFLSLDMTGIPADINVQTGSHGLVSPSWILTRVTQSFRSVGVPYQISNTDIQVFRTGLHQARRQSRPISTRDMPR